MRTRLAAVLATVLAVSTIACRDDGPTGVAGSPRDGRVFIDDFIAADFQAFAGSQLDALSLDNTVKFRGTTALKITVPGPGSYAGGAFVASVPRDLTGYNALTFYARASKVATLNTAGIANDNTGNSQYMSERADIALTTTWQKFTIPIPAASRLNAEAGLFYFAEGPEGDAPYEIWLDDIQFETVANITNPRPTVTAGPITSEVGATQQLSGFSVTYAVGGVDQTQTAAAGYFNLTSSATAVGTVNATGLLTLVGAGATNITATLGATPVVGTIAVTALAAPTVAAPVPTRAPGDVISLFSNTYTNRTVDTWSAVWDNANVSDVTIAGNTAKRYSDLVFAGIEFGSAPVDATAMTSLHFDVFVTNTTNFAITLVDFGANGVYNGPGSDDSEHTIVLNAASSPALTAGAWNSIDLPLSSFTNMTGRTALAQIVIVGSSSITYLDNVYFWRPAP